MTGTTSGRLTIRAAVSAADKAAVVRLRDEVYVADQARLSDVGDTSCTFDIFDEYAVYFLADEGDRPIGTIKVIPDSPAGLPCDSVADLSRLRPGNRLVEFGHLMTVPAVRHRAVGRALMGRALRHSVRTYQATHILGDFFVDGDGQLRPFYTQIGFFPVTAPYRDSRFKDAPLSIVGALDVTDAARRCRAGEGAPGSPLHYFFHDYDEYADTAQPAPKERRR